MAAPVEDAMSTATAIAVRGLIRDMDSPSLALEPVSAPMRNDVLLTGYQQFRADQYENGGVATARAVRIEKTPRDEDRRGVICL